MVLGNILPRELSSKQLFRCITRAQRIRYMTRPQGQQDSCVGRDSG